jgi:hypothetical protein
MSVAEGRLFASGTAEPDTDDWYTPPWVFAGMHADFNIDVASPPDPLPWIPAAGHYCLADDGLEQPWRGLVWCNPPFSDPLPWARRWAKHPAGCFLIRSDLSGRAGHTAFAAASSLYAPRRRMQFVNGHGRTLNANRPNSSVVIFGRGSEADEALTRLARDMGGVTRCMGPGN